MQIRCQTIEEILEIHGEENSRFKDTVLHGATYDSRLVQKGDLFVCIRGENTDGHSFVENAIANGAGAVLCEKKIENVDVPLFCVPDSVAALGKIATFWRTKTRAKVIAVTGTSGKTSVKEGIASVLRGMGKTRASERNCNTQIGMPCSVLQAEGDEDYWVMELGISRPKDMDELGAILQPDVGVIVNVGLGHTEGLGDLGVAHYKSRLLAHLAENGEGIVSGDYPELVWKAMGFSRPLTFFSAHAGSGEGYWARWLGMEKDGFGRYELSLGKEKAVIRSPFVGSFGSEDTIAIATCVHRLGAGIRDIEEGLSRISLPPHRFRRMPLGGWILIDDTYNANPLSMQRMIEASSMEKKPLFFILGEMRELGSEASRSHEALGEELAGYRPCAVLWKGGHFEDVKKGLEKAGYHGPLFPFEKKEEVADIWKSLTLPEEGVVLCKGSRSNHLEDVFDILPGLLERDNVL